MLAEFYASRPDSIYIDPYIVVSRIVQFQIGNSPRHDFNIHIVSISGLLHHLHIGENNGNGAGGDFIGWSPIHRYWKTDSQLRTDKTW